MKNKKLLEGLDLLGYPLLGEEKDFKANEVLAEVIKSGKLRFWEGFPVLFANSAERKLFNYFEVKKYLKKKKDKQTLDSLLIVSLALFKLCNLKFSWISQVYKTMSLEEKRFNEVYEEIKSGKKLRLAGKLLSVDRLRDILEVYLRKEEAQLGDFVLLKEQFNLEYSLSQVFTARQKEIFFKKLKGEKMTKTEREYYSRVVRKKVIALANSQLHRLAQKLI